jgi:hypothetical protein
MPTGINWKPGLLRLWCVGAAVWIAVAAAIFRPDWPASTLWGLGPFGTVNQAKLEGELHAVDGELRRLEGSGVTRTDAALADIDSALSGKPMPAPVANWEKLQTERDAITSQIASAELRAKNWQEIGHFVVLALGLPLAVFLLGVSIIWVARGFVT